MTLKTTPEMIDRVARAILESECPGYPWDSFTKSRYEKLARAAIEAMREPPKAMIDAALGTEAPS